MSSSRYFLERAFFASIFLAVGVLTTSAQTAIFNIPTADTLQRNSARGNNALAAYYGYTF